ncbi:D-hexose-6-phosphate mutarotase [Pasteurella oralis]|uniref:Putative glucose-6-phosphate 1-epimerase n=1 Tax=Pasteurella oralis TaxID=1071947 RepID=A0ABW4NT46_9PAST
MINITKMKQFTPELTLYRYNEIPVLELSHRVGEAKIALQGAQLLSWRPQNESQDILWLSDIEPFILENPIRGGVPICYPWFGAAKQPIHGTARLRLWQLSHHDITSKQVKLEFALFDTQNILEAKATMSFTDKCEITLIHYAQHPAQAALHSYFKLSNIAQVTIQNLPRNGFNAITQQQEDLPSTRRITQDVDCIYSVEEDVNYIVDEQFERRIKIEHQHASEIVLWNPWQNQMSAMQAEDYQQMICLESARIYQPLSFGESLSVVLSSKNH